MSARTVSITQYRCEFCGNWWQRTETWPSTARSCLVVHYPKDCCHYNEVQLTEGGVFRTPYPSLSPHETLGDEGKGDADGR